MKSAGLKYKNILLTTLAFCMTCILTIYGLELGKGNHVKDPVPGEDKDGNPFKYYVGWPGEERVGGPHQGLDVVGKKGGLIYNQNVYPVKDRKVFLLRVILSFCPLEVKENPVMVIPTGGLYGMQNSEQFKSMLRDYVAQGGTLIVFSQQHGYEYKALPGGEEIKAYGWQEDISCFYDSTYIDWWHPVFARIKGSKISIPVDGYFIRIP